MEDGTTETPNPAATGPMMEDICGTLRRRCPPSSGSS